MKKDKCHVVIIEPSEIVLRGLCRIFEECSWLKVAGTYSDVLKYLERSTQWQADVVIINPTLISYNKRGAVKTLFPGSLLIALLYSYINKEVLLQFDDSIDIYDKSAKIIHRLELVMSQGQPELVTSDQGELSDREKEILVAVAKGLINKEIAELHNISVHTVISHRKNISRKTGIKSVSGFVVYALLNSLLEETDIR